MQSPGRACVIFAKLLYQKTGIKITRKDIRQTLGIPERDQARIVASKQVRTCHNVPDSGPDPRGQNRALTRNETAAIADYTDGGTVPLDDRGAPWQDLAEASGVILPETYHFKPPGYRTVEGQSIQKACRDDEGIVNAIYAEERLLNPRQCNEREAWCRA